MMLKTWSTSQEERRSLQEALVASAQQRVPPARLGLINSPDRREGQTTLEEFMEQLVSGKELGLEEEDVRTQMAAQYALDVMAFTKMLYEQATEEQRKGTKGLTKFLALWRKQLAAQVTPTKSRADSWSIVGTSPEDEGQKPTTPRRAKVKEEPREGSVPTKKNKTFATSGPPGIYGQEDRKAGTGGDGESGEAMADLAKAIQHQTTELATLVRAQHEGGNNAAGTIKALNRTSEELMFLLRACGQYTVTVGEGEYGAGLAQALLSAQAGASKPVSVRRSQVDSQSALQDLIGEHMRSTPWPPQTL